ncbi:MAG TPA: hypothetical protein VEN30_22025 [Paraburkholderia sp.]|nr:hypothetical protein [Paraburkholderia sp.]
MLRDMACAASGNERVRTLAFRAEGGLFQSIGIPTVVGGPGSNEQGHKADEFVDFEQLAQCLAFLERIVAGVCTSPRARICV